MILGRPHAGSDLERAFLAPKTTLHLQFAYYESSLVVEYLIDHFGFDSLKKVSADLGQGKPYQPGD